MSFITLIKYHDLFTKYGFESYFEDYYKVMFASPRDMNEAMTVNMRAAAPGGVAPAAGTQA